MTAATLLDETVLIEPPLQETACDLVEELGDVPVTELVLRAGGHDFVVPEPLQQLLLQVIGHAAEGGAFTMKSMPEEVTTTVAADMLGISRPTLMKLIAAGEITPRKVGSHNRLASQDVIRLSKKRADARRAAFESLRELEDELGEE